MRLISQDGTIDIPYENVMLEESYVGIYGDGLARRGIEAYFALHERPKCIALYSSEEKAKKAMEMLRDTYIGMPIVMQNVDVSEDMAKEFERLKKCGVMVQADNQPSKVEYINNAVFQFPEDDEVEV
jgi:hypothetical protein